MKNLKLFSLFAILIGSVLSAAAAVVFNPAALIVTAAALPLADVATFRAFYAAVRNIGLPQGVIAAPGHIISENTIASGTTSYTFATRQTSIDGTISTFPLQKGVKDNDLFIAYKFGILLDNRTASTSPNVDRQSFASYAVFNSVTNTFADLRAFYNGFLNYKVGATTFLDQFSTAEFEKVPQTQKTSAANENEYSLDWALSDVGARPIFSGKADNEVQLQLIGSSGFNPSASSGVNVVAFVAKGVILKNGANDPELYKRLVEASLTGR